MECYECGTSSAEIIKEFSGKYICAKCVFWYDYDELTEVYPELKDADEDQEKTEFE